MTNPPWGSEPENHEPDPTAPYQPYGAPQQPSTGYGAPGAQPYPGMAHPVPGATNGLAIGSLVTSIAGLALCCGLPSIVGAILGHVARRQIRERGESGDGLALAGIIVGWLAFGLFLFVATFYVLAFVVSL